MRHFPCSKTCRQKHGNSINSTRQPNDCWNSIPKWRHKKSHENANKFGCKRNIWKRIRTRSFGNIQLGKRITDKSKTNKKRESINEKSLFWIQAGWKAVIPVTWQRIKKFGFYCNKADNCVDIYTKKGVRFTSRLHIDDIFIACLNLEKMRQIICFNPKFDI